jgi:SAM-dependent methyltransferase
MIRNSSRFTEQWDAVDPFDASYPHLWIKVEHLGRYLFAERYLATINTEIVLDAGAGTGYGSEILARSIPSVISLDAHLQQPIESDSIHQVNHDIESRPFRDVLDGVRPDAIVCFETLEHLIDPLAALAEFSEIQSSGNTLLLSVPNSVAERTGPEGLLTNPFHRRAFTISSICSLLEHAGYGVREVLGQQLATDINSNETRLIRRKQANGRIGDEPVFHERPNIERLALVIGYPEPRDVERSYSLIIVAERL